jgi:hypothetical protein
MGRLVVLLAAFVFTGCYTTVGPLPGRPTDGSPHAVYRHPDTGDVRHCLDRTVQGALLGGVIGGISAGSAYADCKSALEATGYTREPDAPKTGYSDAEKVFCRHRAANAGGSDAWSAAYYRCLAGY